MLRTKAKDFLIRKCKSTATQSNQATGVGDPEAAPKKQINHGLIEDSERRRPRDSWWLGGPAGIEDAEDNHILNSYEQPIAL